MALKNQFEDANFISSPFVDEIANPGNLRGPTPDPGFVDPQDKSGGTRGTPLTKVQNKFLADQKAESKPSKPIKRGVVDTRTPRQKVEDKNKAVRDALAG